MRIWGRVNSANVQKVLWTCTELDLEYERIDAGMQFGRVNDAEYRALNPNGRIPTLEDNGLVLWESNSVSRYLCNRHPDRSATLYPADPAIRGGVDRWLDWQLSTLQPAERLMFWNLVRTPPEKRNAAQIAESRAASIEAWKVIEGQLAHGHSYLEGADVTLADIIIGVFARRWFGVPLDDRPSFPALEAWYARLQTRPGFIKWISPALT